MKQITPQYIDILTAAGLSEEEAVVYEILITIGESTASTIAKAIPRPYTISRPLVYKVLESLGAKQLAERHDPAGKVSTFLPLHPVAITKLLEEQKQTIEQTQAQVAPVVGQLTSLFNLTSGKPGVQFFEGKDGLWELLLDSLQAQEEILTYADLEAINQFIPDLNAEYSTLREEKSVQKRGLVIDSPAARKFLKSYTGDTTKTKLIPPTDNYAPFQTNTQIYDDKISYMTLSDQYLIGLIITDRYIANTHKYLFESMWETANGEVV